MTAEDAVNQVIEMYIESMEKSSGDMVTEAFHENAKVVGYLNGDFLQLSTSDFAGFVSAQEPGTVEFEILSCEVNGDTATAKVRDKYLGISFLDSLSLVKEGDRWSIYNKLFHVEAWSKDEVHKDISPASSSPRSPILTGVGDRTNVYARVTMGVWLTSNQDLPCEEVIPSPETAHHE